MTIQEITNTQNEIIENIFANKENFLKIYNNVLSKVLPTELKKELLRQAIAFEVHKHKWLESEKVGYDVGYEYAWIDWNSKYRKDFVRSRKIAA